MVRVLIPVLLLLIGLGGGIAAGLFLGAGQDAAGAGEDAAADPDDREPAVSTQDDDAASADPGTTEFVRLNNQFVVPVVRHGSVRSLVVMALTVEVDAGANEVVFDREPRLRDAMLRVMFAHANTGGFDGNFTEAAAMSPLRSALREAAQSVLGDVAHDVLIVDITRQDA
ncbi:MAG: flagellar basal body-associated FliL family protein [Octadecabacter sp.]|nr:flagellar basal body-associated FliL family protein [Octadecabacter sp.]